MRYLVWLLLVLLVLVQQDYWRWWDAPVVVLSFLPRPLAVQMGVSIAAGFVWWLATKYCWPLDPANSPGDPPRLSDSGATGISAATKKKSIGIVSDATHGVQVAHDETSDDKGAAS
jgi:hypothetical protein